MLNPLDEQKAQEDQKDRYSWITPADGRELASCYSTCYGYRKICCVNDCYK